MTLRKLAVSFILVFVFASQAIAQVDIGGTWQARYMFTDITAHVDNMNEAVSGFLIVYEAQNNAVYHFTGILKENTIQASHSDGYTFTGHLTSEGRIVGTLTTNKGLTIQLVMTRTSQQACGK
ncbi:MAG TPA: hypothetical protein HPP81_02015 [Deltaproteobacteria bacterium]|jgi:hypothetical protein|nr:hypothetical protein [Deltaproteobacteria bacterium]